MDQREFDDGPDEGVLNGCLLTRFERGDLEQDGRELAYEVGEGLAVLIILAAHELD